MPATAPRLTAQQAIEKLGLDISTARRRRRLKQADMAKQMQVSRQTLHRLEHGDATVSLMVLVHALGVLGLAARLADLASPEQDALALENDLQQLPQRIRFAKGE